MRRCHDPKHSAYKDYGGRGLYVCERWRSFLNFASDVGARPSLKHSIDRIDNDMGYGPENCRWATLREQQGNKRNNLWIEHNGERMILARWAEKLDVKPNDIWRRIKRGWSIRDAIEVPFGLKSKTDVSSFRADLTHSAASDKCIRIGSTYGKWTVLNSIRQSKPGSGKPRYYECACACGVQKSVRGTHLASGSSKSCFKCAIAARESPRTRSRDGHG